MDKVKKAKTIFIIDLIIAMLITIALILSIEYLVFKSKHPVSTYIFFISMCAALYYYITFVIMSFKKLKLYKKQQLEDEELLKKIPTLEIMLLEQNWKGIEEIENDDNLDEETKKQIHNWHLRQVADRLLGLVTGFDKKYNNKTLKTVLNKFNIKSRNEAFQLIADPKTTLTEEEENLLKLYLENHQ